MEQQTIQNILSTEVQQFIRDNENADVQTLVLKNPKLFGLPSHIVAEQLSGRRKAKDKIPSFYHANIVYPQSLNLEQSSSEQTAIFKARIFLETLAMRRSLLDLTGGFGVDSYFLSKVFKSVSYVEPNSVLFNIVKENHRLLNSTNINHQNTTAETFLAEGQEASAIFIDPSRRNADKKVFAFADCVPNVAALKDEIFKASPFLMVKASPLLDLKDGAHELSFVMKMFVVAVDSEVKEVLYLCKNGFAGEPVVEAWDLRKETSEKFSFTFSEESGLKVSFSDPKKYLYEPNAAILKAGGFKSISAKFGLAKIHPSTHLYTSESLISDFPGRIFKVEAEVKPENKSIRNLFPDGKANVTTRNYPLSVEDLKKKTGLRDGGSKFLVGFSGQTKKFLIAAERVK